MQLILATGSVTDVKYIQWSVLDVPTCVALNKLGVPLGPASPVVVRHTTPATVRIKAGDGVLKYPALVSYC